MVGGNESGRLTRLLSPGPGLELKACMVLGSRPDRGGTGEERVTCGISSANSSATQ
jgi:hypothetical protein